MKNYTFEFNGDILERTNYFASQAAKDGEFFLIFQRDNYKLLVPDILKGFLAQMRPAKKIEILRFSDRIEIIFDDFTHKHFVITIANEQAQCAFEEGQYTLSVYISMGEKFRFQCTVFNKTQHGNTGNNYAAKDDGATSRINIRVTPEEKAAWVKAAHPGKLSEWMRVHLNKQAEAHFKRD